MYLYVVSEALNGGSLDNSEELARESLLQDLADLGESARVSTIDIGRGASCGAFSIILDWLPTLSPIALFFLGGQIEKNLDAWISLARRLRTLADKLRQIGHPPVISFEAACAIAFDEIAANGWHKSELEISHIVLSNKYVQMHYSFPSMEALKEFVEADRKQDFDPLAAEAIYTFLGSADGKLFIVTVDGDGAVLVSRQLY